VRELSSAAAVPLESAAPAQVEVTRPRAVSTRVPVQARRRAAFVVAACAILLDAALLWLAFCGSYYLRYTVQWVPVEHGTVWVPFRDWVPFGITFSLVELGSLMIAGSYRERLGRDLLDEVLVSCRSSLVGIGVIVIITAFLPIKFPSRLLIVYTWILLIPLLALGRAMLDAGLGRLHRRGWNTRRVLVAGSTPIGKMVMQNLLSSQRNGYELVGFLQGSLPAAGSNTTVPLVGRVNFGRFKCLGSVSDLVQVMDEFQVDEVIVTLPATHHGEIADICAHCESAQVAVKLVPDLFEMSLSRVHMDHLAGIPLIDVRRTHPGRAARAVKRGMDLGISCLALLILSPLLLLIALAIKLDSRGPIFNCQRRVGKGGVEFTFYKFRSMHENANQMLDALIAKNGIADPRIFKDRHDPRRTRVGRVIRRMSLDEVPQLLNVLKGDMSLVGPRPPLPTEVATYEPHHRKRLEVIGGLTGQWQVNGRSDIKSFEEIIMMDTYYIDNWSLALDMKILLRTVLAVVSRKGAY
jgi:exopolysaccharide biosynthesis polyprenyl glycosylphosphotransferase